MKKILQWLAVAVFAVLVFVPALAQAQTVPTTITSFRVTDKNKQDLTSAFTNQDIYLTASWSATGEVHEGDTFSLAIPDILDFPATNAASFNIYAPDGAVMANAQVTPGQKLVFFLVSRLGVQVAPTFLVFLFQGERLKTSTEGYSCFPVSRQEAKKVPRTFSHFLISR